MVERKLATVLFVDLVESTELVSAHDPEVVRRRVTRFFENVSRCIVTHGGTVEKFAGDAVMAAFGIPRAHEDDAERAVRAALAIMESVEDLELEARIGVEARSSPTTATRPSRPARPSTSPRGSSSPRRPGRSSSALAPTGSRRARLRPRTWGRSS